MQTNQIDQGTTYRGGLAPSPMPTPAIDAEIGRFENTVLEIRQALMVLYQRTVPPTPQAVNKLGQSEATAPRDTHVSRLQRANAELSSALGDVRTIMEQV